MGDFPLGPGVRWAGFPLIDGLSEGDSSDDSSRDGIDTEKRVCLRGKDLIMTS